MCQVFIVLTVFLECGRVIIAADRRRPKTHILIFEIKLVTTFNLDSLESAKNTANFNRGSNSGPLHKTVIFRYD